MGLLSLVERKAFVVSIINYVAGRKTGLLLFSSLSHSGFARLCRGRIVD